LASHPKNYPYGSYAVYAEGEENSLITLSPAYLGLSDTPSRQQKLYADYVMAYRPQEEFANSTLVTLNY
jgi:hypothetical protein